MKRKPSLLFYDPATPIAYTDITLKESALRGTESTIVRIAHSLKNYYQIYIAQHCRPTTDNVASDDVNYISFETAHKLTPDIVVLLRYHRLLEKVAITFPHARHYFWLHNLPSRNLHSYRETLIKHHYHLIAVSHFHKKIIEKRLQGKWYHQLLRRKALKTSIPVSVIYNPINDNLHPDASPVNNNQLIFTSSFYKGLKQTLKIFTLLHQHFPDYELLIISPDKLDNSITLPEKAHFLGPLPPHLLTQYIRRSFCVFYPQTERVETFGLVYAEANALGTPVLAHDFGAASEILSDTCQLINGHDIQTIIKKLMEWQNQRPLIKAKAEFRLQNVVQSWLILLNQN